MQTRTIFHLSYQHQQRQNPQYQASCDLQNEKCVLLDQLQKCSQQYTGETKLEFHLRMNKHKSDLRINKKSTGMMRHFSNCGVTNIQPAILERVRSSDPFIRKAREQFYIELLGTDINAQ